MGEDQALFINMYDTGNFDSGRVDYHAMLRECTVQEKQSGGDGYIEVTKVLEIGGRFFQVDYTLMGKDLDEVYDFELSGEVFPHKVEAIEYRTYK